MSDSMYRKNTLVKDEEGSITKTPAPALSTSLPSTSAEAGPRGLHAFLVALGMSLQSPRTLHQILALVLFVVMTMRMNEDLQGQSIHHYMNRK